MLKIKGNESVMRAELGAQQTILLHPKKAVLSHTLTDVSVLKLELSASRFSSIDDWVTQAIYFEWKAGETTAYFNGIVQRVSLFNNESIELIAECPQSRLKQHYQNRHFCQTSLRELIHTLVEPACPHLTSVAFETDAVDVPITFVKQHNESTWDLLFRLLTLHGCYLTTLHHERQVTWCIHELSTTVEPQHDMIFVGEQEAHQNLNHVRTFQQIVRSPVPNTQYVGYDDRNPHVHWVKQPEEDTTKATAQRLSLFVNDASALEAHMTRHTQGLNADVCQCIAKTYAMTVQPGDAMTLSAHPRAVFNQSFFVTSVEHSIDESTKGERYSNTLICQPSLTPFRLPPHFAESPQSEIGLATIHADSETPNLTDHGEYQIKFLKDDEPTTPVRLMQPYVGHEYGMHFPFHQDAQVVVAYLNGERDKPIILGGLYHDGMRNPVTSDNPYHHVLRTQSGHTFLMDDTPDAQQIVLHTPNRENYLKLDETQASQKIELISEKGAMHVNVGESTHITTHAHASIKADESLTVEAKESIRLSSLNEGVYFSAKQDIMQHAGRDMMIHADKHYHLTVKGDAKTEVQGDMSTFIKNGNHQLMVESGSIKQEARGNITLQSQSGQLQLRAGKASLTLTPDGHIAFAGTKIAFHIEEQGDLADALGGTEV